MTSTGQTQQQLQLRFPVTPADHATVLHPVGARGCVTVAWKDGARWRELHVPVPELPEVVSSFAGKVDSYLSQNRFYGPRRIATLAELNALFTDLDYYRVPQYDGLHPWAVLELVLDALQDERIPAPSLAVATGRGLALVWLHTPVPRAAIPRWNACQQRIFEALQGFGADPKALDAARVLRLIGTRHGKTGRLVEALTVPTTPWPFDALADEVLPLSRAELYDLRIQRAKRRAKRPPEASRTVPQGFTQATLWEARLTDLQRLLDLRHWRPLPPGHRDAWMFVAGVAMSWIAQPVVLERELWYLARQVGSWDTKEAKSRLCTVMARARAAARGEKVEWCGQEVDPRYRLRTSTIINWLGITPEEQRHMSSLIGPEIRRERERQRWHRRREAAGGLSREEYLAQADERRREAHRLRGEGLTQREIAKVLGVTQQAVSYLLRGYKSTSGCMVAKPCLLDPPGE
jgi:hypothetical protein